MSDKNLLAGILEANAPRTTDKVKEKEKVQEKKIEKLISKASGSKAPAEKKKDVVEQGDKFDKLGEIFKNGFQNMNQTIESMGEKIAEKISGEIKPLLEVQLDEEYSDEYFGDGSEEEEAPNVEDVLTSISKEFVTTEAQGPEVSKTLGKLVDTLLSTKPCQEIVNSREARHLKPKNVSFIGCPQVNKQVWYGLKRSTRAQDFKLQSVQKEFLKSAIPITKVIDSLHAGHEQGNELDVPSLIKNLSDSLAFLGSANMEMVKCRREIIKDEIPQKMKGICDEETEFSGSLLFGDNLLQKMKEVSEGQKVSEELKKSDAPVYRGNNSRYQYRPFFKRGIAGRQGRARYAPYQRRGSFFERGRRGNHPQGGQAQRSRLVSRKY